MCIRDRVYCLIQADAYHNKNVVDVGLLQDLGLHSIYILSVSIVTFFKKNCENVLIKRMMLIVYDKILFKTLPME